MCTFIFAHRSEKDCNTYVNASFKVADKAGKGKLSFADFSAYYSTLTTTRARQQLRTSMGLAAEGKELHACCPEVHVQNALREPKSLTIC